MRMWTWIALPALALCGLGVAQDSKQQQQQQQQQQGAYVNDFQNETTGALPKDMMVLAGEFKVAEEAGNKFILLPGSPLESFGLLIGPEGAISCQARIRATSTGRRTPEFGVGLAGAAGYKLWLMPAARELQIIKGEERVAKVPYAWTSGSWTVMRVEIQPAADGRTRVAGKAWAQELQEPKDWMITFDDGEAPSKGRSSVWGTPYSDTPIAFDDIVVTTQPK